MKKREPPQIGDLVCLTYNTDTIGIVVDIWNCHNTNIDKGKMAQGSREHLERQNGTNFGHYCDSVLLHLEEVCSKQVTLVQIKIPQNEESTRHLACNR